MILEVNCDYENTVYQATGITNNFDVNLASELAQFKKNKLISRSKYELEYRKSIDDIVIKMKNSDTDSTDEYPSYLKIDYIEIIYPEAQTNNGIKAY